MWVIKEDRRTGKLAQGYLLFKLSVPSDPLFYLRVFWGVFCGIRVDGSRVKLVNWLSWKRGS